MNAINLLFLTCILFSVGGYVEGADQKTSFFEAFRYGHEAASDVPALFDEIAKHDEPYQDFVSKGFACPSLPAPPDTNTVKNLRPGNIKVVMALGDSITAAMSAKDTNVLNLHEYRGLSFPIGADPGVVTIPNILKSYAPAGFPVGGSTGIGKRESTGNGLDGAVSGAINKDMLGQVVWLVSALKANKLINVTSDWKLLTLWIGSNNLCQYCNDAKNNDATNYVNSVTEALDYLFANVPRVFVSIVSQLDVTQLYSFKAGACLLHGYECSCAGSSDSKKRALVTSGTLAYQQAAYGIANYYAAKNSTQFAVVVQPFLVNTIIPDRSYLSQADCFHPAAKAHEAFSISLWNNLITPAAQKRTKWDPNEVALCADKDTLVYTY